MKSKVPPLTLKAGMLAAFIVAVAEVTNKKYSLTTVTCVSRSIETIATLVSSLLSTLMRPVGPLTVDSGPLLDQEPLTAIVTVSLLPFGIVTAIGTSSLG
jgi:hypothetical protein